VASESLIDINIIENEKNTAQKTIIKRYFNKAVKENHGQFSEARPNNVYW